MKNLVIILALTFALKTQAQVISKFTWSSNPLTTAAQGPNGTSVSPVATSTYIGGTLGYAINPGLPTHNIDLVIPGSPSFDINSMDLSLYFRREESQASFFKRGANFDFGSNGGQLSVKFTTTRGSTPGDTVINSGNIVAIADDHTFHQYRFRYDNNTGVANVYVDGTIVYTYTGVAGRPLSWTGAGNVIIGENMDATSRDIAVLSNLSVALATAAMLPLHIISFNAAEKSTRAQINWTVTEESEVSKYTVERSADNMHFKSVGVVTASMSGTYSFVDDAPVAGTNYYRLRVEENNGKVIYSAIRQINIATAGAAVSAKCYPNPATDHVNIDLSAPGTYNYTVVNLSGAVVKTGSVLVNGSRQQLRIELGNAVPSNTYAVKLNNHDTNSSQTFLIVKK